MFDGGAAFGKGVAFGGVLCFVGEWCLVGCGVFGKDVVFDGGCGVW